MARISRITDSWFTQLVGFDRTYGRIAFSVQCPSAPVDGVMDYVRLYHRIDPHMNQALQQPVCIPYNSARVAPSFLIEPTKALRFANLAGQAMLDAGCG